MKVYETILKRRSVRKYNTKKVSDEQIERLLKAAMAAPTALNKKPWEFFVIKNEDILKKIKKVAFFMNFNSPLVIMVAGNQKNASTKKINDFWIQDCAAAIENMLLAATEMGLSTCWCGLYPQERPIKRIKQILPIKDYIIPLAIIHIGYSDQVPEARTQYDKKKVHIID